MKQQIGIVLIAIAIVVIVGGAWILITTQGKERLIVSTTTSLYETGLLDVLDAQFEAKHPTINVSFISQGTGLAIQTAMRGDADMILVHDVAREKAFLNGGYGVNRKIVAYNYFVIVGPDDDPASVEGLDPVNALLAIKAAGESGEALWVSRGDDSGTHAKEKRLWIMGGENTSLLRETSWYLEAGTGMTTTLNLADEKRAYTLCDLGSYLNNYVLGNIDLEIVVEAGRDTLNVYGVIACDPRNEGLSHVKFDSAMKFIEFLVSDDVQEIFAEFGISAFGQPLFNPAVEVLETDVNPTTASWIREQAFIEGSECPLEKRYEAGDLTFLNITFIFQSIWRESRS
ncbi:MAG: substrate-binding domain-containing protein [Candidatus Bathyarchaeota archaeon]|nr:MAG: substrate-binding domain-containing protein [Candidatus Bathyarchaeota archaeon]